MLQCSEGSLYICWQFVARNKLCQAPDNSLVQWHLHATWLFMFYFSLLSPARPLIGQYLSILASDWFSWVSEDDSRKEWGESRVQKHVCLARTDQWEARTETSWPMRGLVTFEYITDSCEGVRHLMWRVGSPAPGHKRQPMRGEYCEWLTNERLSYDDTWPPVWGAADDNDMRTSGECQHSCHMTMPSGASSL